VPAHACPHIVARFHESPFEDLSAEDQSWVAEHLARCPPCRAYAEGLSAVPTLVGRSLSEDPRCRCKETAAFLEDAVLRALGLRPAAR
jgi:hypothetical protein